MIVEQQSKIMHKSEKKIKCNLYSQGHHGGSTSPGHWRPPHLLTAVSLRKGKGNIFLRTALKSNFIFTLSPGKAVQVFTAWPRLFFDLSLYNRICNRNAIYYLPSKTERSSEVNSGTEQQDSKICHWEKMSRCLLLFSWILKAIKMFPDLWGPACFWEAVKSRTGAVAGFCLFPVFSKS